MGYPHSAPVMPNQATGRQPEVSAPFFVSVVSLEYYQVLADPAEGDGLLRIIDNTGEDYLYAAELFQAATDLSGLSTDFTLSLSVPMKAAILQLASQRGMSMAALVR